MVARVERLVQLFLVLDLSGPHAAVDGAADVVVVEGLDEEVARCAGWEGTYDAFDAGCVVLRRRERAGLWSSRYTLQGRFWPESKWICGQCSRVMSAIRWLRGREVKQGRNRAAWTLGPGSHLLWVHGIDRKTRTRYCVARELERIPATLACSLWQPTRACGGSSTTLSPPLQNGTQPATG